jgi:HK97 family phage prohead protease
MKKETRYLVATELRVVRAEGKSPALEGYAAVFNSESHDLGGFVEQVKSGAFARAIKAKADVRALINHDPSLILGRTKSGTLVISEDDRGLRFHADLGGQDYATNLYESVERGDIDQCSFSFKAVKQSWGERKNPDGSWIATRDLEDVDLYDVSAVTYPAYEGTSVAARARWADEVPTEVRSLIETHEAEDAAAVVDARLYKDTKDIPDYVPESKKAQWLEVWNSAYKAAIKDGKAKDDAEKSAFAQANGVAGPNADKKSDPPKGEQRDENEPLDSFEDVQAELNEELAAKFGYSPQGWQAVWLIETFDDYAIVCKCEPEKDYFKISYSIGADGHEITLGNLEPVTLEYVPAERMLKLAVAARGVKVVTGQEVSIPAQKEAPSDPVDAGHTLSANHRDDGDCEDPNCECQNVMADGSAVEIEETERAALTAESAFAFVGDPDKTETWKLPVHDEEHARNALARFNQTQGIPAAKKAGVYRKIVAAAKKFGIEVSETNSLELAGLETDERNLARASSIMVDSAQDEANRAKLAALL